MVETRVYAGICGFTTEIHAQSDDMQNVSFDIKSDCPNVVKLANEFPIVDGYQEIADGYRGAIYTRAMDRLVGCCSGCVVPCAIFKSMQAAAGLALPASSLIDIKKK